MMKAAVLLLLVLVSVALAGDECKSSQYFKDLTVKLPLFDANDDGSLVEVSQRFDLNTSAIGDLSVAINCVDYDMSGLDMRNCFRGAIVIRAYDFLNDGPGDILYFIDPIYTGICPYGHTTYAYTESFRVTIPAKYDRILFVGYRTNATKGAHSIIFAADQGVTPIADNFMWTNLTNTWERTSRYYGHLGINADIIVP